MLHIQAVPQLHLVSNSLSIDQTLSTLPELSRSETLQHQKSERRTKWSNVPSKTKSSLPDIEETRSSSSNPRFDASLSFYGAHESIIPSSSTTDNRTDCFFPILHSSAEDEAVSTCARIESLRKDEVKNCKPKSEILSKYSSNNMKKAVTYSKKKVRVENISQRLRQRL